MQQVTCADDAPAARYLLGPWLLLPAPAGLLRSDKTHEGTCQLPQGPGPWQYNIRKAAVHIQQSVYTANRQHRSAAQHSKTSTGADTIHSSRTAHSLMSSRSCNSQPRVIQHTQCTTSGHPGHSIHNSVNTLCHPVHPAHNLMSSRSYSTQPHVVQVTQYRTSCHPGHTGHTVHNLMLSRSHQYRTSCHPGHTGHTVTQPHVVQVTQYRTSCHPGHPGPTCRSQPCKAEIRALECRRFQPPPLLVGASAPIHLLHRVRQRPCRHLLS